MEEGHQKQVSLLLYILHVRIGRDVLTSMQKAGRVLSMLLSFRCHPLENGEPAVDFITCLNQLVEKCDYVMAPAPLRTRCMQKHATGLLLNLIAIFIPKDADVS